MMTQGFDLPKVLAMTGFLLSMVFLFAITLM
jgi:hypothetical protein